METISSSEIAPVNANESTQPIREVQLWELEQYKEEITELYSDRKVRLKDLPEVVEERLHIRAR